MNVALSFLFQKADMEEMTIWEQHTVTLSKVSSEFECLIRFSHTFIELCTGVSENVTLGVEFP